MAGLRLIMGSSWRYFMLVALVALAVGAGADGRGGARGGGEGYLEGEGGEEFDDWAAGGAGVRTWDGQIVWDDDVVVLNGRNLHSFVRRHSHVLVQFYAKWCGHCKKFDPIYRKAASHLRLEGSTAILAKVDGPANPNLSKGVGVAGFPSLHWFAYGEERAYEGGRRNDSLVEWVTHHARGDAVTIVSSQREAEDFLAREGAEEAVLGRFPGRHTREARAFMLAAEEDTVGRGTRAGMIRYVMVTEGWGIGMAKLGSQAGEERPKDEVQGPAIGPAVLLRRSAAAGGGTVVLGRWYVPPMWHTSTPDVRYTLFHPERIKAFVGTYRMPSVVSLSPSSWGKVLASPNRNQTILFSDEGSEGHGAMMEAFEEVGRQMFGRVLFLHIQSNNTNVLQYFGMSPGDFPAVVVAVAPDGEFEKGQMHRLDQTQDGNNLTTILRAHVGGEGRCAEGGGGGGTCGAGGGWGRAVGRMAQVVRGFAFSAFEGSEAEFELPKEDLEQDIHYPDDPVVRLTPGNLSSVARDSGKDVVVKFFAPWCGHCKAMRVGYMELCDRMELHTDVTVAEFDAHAHKVPAELADLVQGFPTVLLFPAGAEGSAHQQPIMYEGERDAGAMASWVEKHAVTVQAKAALEGQIRELEGEQQAAVKEERFEDAARIRDELAGLRKQVAGSKVLAPGAGTPKHRMPTFGPKILRETMHNLNKKNKEEEEAQRLAREQT